MKNKKPKMGYKKMENSKMDKMSDKMVAMKMGSKPKKVGKSRGC